MGILAMDVQAKRRREGSFERINVITATQGGFNDDTSWIDSPIALDSTSITRDDSPTSTRDGSLASSFSQDFPLSANFFQFREKIGIPHGSNEEQYESSVGEDDSEYYTHCR